MSVQFFCIVLLKTKADPTLNVKLSDMCIGTSAAPLYFPPYYFSDEDKDGKTTEFNLIDGGVSANDPVKNNRRTISSILCFPKIYKDYN